MARSLRMPPPGVLPRGPRRTFAEELFEHYKAARRPTLREISDLIREDEELRGTASRETVRRMLLGEVVPAQWHTVNAVFVTLCKIAGRDPGATRYISDFQETTTHAEAIEEAWHRAVDDLPPEQAQYDGVPF